jgi:rhamnosyltransferase
MLSQRQPVWWTAKFASAIDSSSEQPLSVSVIIRNRNEAVYLRQVLLALSAQAVSQLELVLVDDTSRDDSVAVARSYGAIVVQLPEGEFTYGRALNAGLSVASGDICVILSAHSLPLGNGFINSCVAPFRDPRTAAVRCVYVGKGSDLTRWTAPEILNASSTLQDVISRGPLASGCAIRRSVWLEIPFDENVLSAEDKLWASSVLQAGYTILSPCDAFYLYIKPIPPAVSLRNEDRDLRAIFNATGERFGPATVGSSTTFARAARRIVTGVPRAVFTVVNQELTRIRLRLAFPDFPAQTVSDKGAREGARLASNVRDFISQDHSASAYRDY